ncbi:MAG: aminotransferase class III-fold pyridoxal phosphate-dependent enzyme [Candidatus Pristimantibacillus sp.]
MYHKYAKSNELLDRARKVTPLGAQTFSKSHRYYCESNAPSFIDHGNGCYVFDVDGNKYVDFVCALGPITIGYNDKRVNEAIIKQLEKGIIFSQQTEVEVRLAEKLSEIIPCAEMTRFVKNGSDATTAAIRLARAYTGRDLIAASGYHGMHDWYIGSTTNDKGVPKAVGDLTKNFTYNDLDSLERLFNEYPNQIAAVILEPIQGDGPEKGYLEGLKELTHRFGALLIFDEVVSGFRYALGGASEMYGVIPDLAAFGKGMGNGLPISAVSGRRDIMKLIEEGVFISTTFGGEALSLAGALEVIRILEQPGTYEHVWSLGTLMLTGLEKLIKKHSLEEVLSVSGLAPHCGLSFEGSGALDYLDINSIYSETMVNNGILTLAINNISLSHTTTEIDLFLKAADEAMLNIKQVISQGSVKSFLSGGKINPVFKRNIK